MTLALELARVVAYHDWHGDEDDVVTCWGRAHGLVLTKAGFAVGARVHGETCALADRSQVRRLVTRPACRPRR